MNQLVMLPTTGLLPFIKQDAAWRAQSKGNHCLYITRGAGLSEGEELASVNSPCVGALTQK